jgi:hypothetical protein
MWFQKSLPQSLVVACAAVAGLWLSPSEGAAQSLLPPPSVVMSNQIGFYSSSSSRILSPTPFDVLTTNSTGETTDPSGQPVYACACGCGIYDVGTSQMFPMGAGGMVWEQYDFQDQVTNWNGHTSVQPGYNPDKKIETSFYTTGFQYMFNRSWGIQVEMPIADRFFETTGGATGHDIVHSTWTALGDIRVMGIYDGFSEDQSIGIEGGIKLPTGDYTHNNAYGDVDRDSEIGTGSTDLLLGAFARHTLVPQLHIDGFGQILLDLPFSYRSSSSGSYRPGAELDSACGAYYTGLHFGNVDVVPIAQVLCSVRRQDSGSGAADPIGSGYQRILLSPGIEVDVNPFMFYADVELPVYQNTNGDQLVGSFLIKGSVSYRF